ncbi:MAG TPA: TonB family protein [Nannocystaceae bacterium]|nr:TonB family protein [Nannocystaceae bacterium]
MNDETRGGDAEQDATMAIDLPREVLEVLEEWTVPEMPTDMKERVMSQMHEQWNVATPPMPSLPAPSNGANVLAMVVAAVAATAAAAALAITWQRGEMPAPPPQQQPTAVALPPEMARPVRAHLTLEVAPADATVEIDGRTLDGPSPFVATGLSVGRHEVVVKHEGHVEWKRFVDLPDGQLHLPIALVPVAPSAPGKSDGSDVDAAGPVPDDTPAAKVTQGTGEVKGALDKDIIRRIVRAHINEVRYCFDQGLVRDKTLGGRVVVEFTVNGEGKVPTAHVTESTVKDDAVGQCIAKAVKRWRFPKPEGGGNVVVAYPFLLEAD